MRREMFFDRMEKYFLKELLELALWVSIVAEKLFSAYLAWSFSDPWSKIYIYIQIMNEPLLENLRNHHDIADHAYYFLAACMAKSIGSGASYMKTTTKSMFNHIRWLERLVGKALLTRVKPGQTMKLTATGKKLFKELRQDFEEAVNTLNLNKAEGIIERGFTEVITEPGIALRQPSIKNHNTKKMQHASLKGANNTCGT